MTALGVGTPRDSTAFEYQRPCPDCDEETVQTPDVDWASGVVEVRCEACGALVEVVEPT